MKKGNSIRDEMMETHRAMLAKYKSQRTRMQSLQRRNPDQAVREREENRMAVLHEVEEIEGLFEREILPILQDAKRHVPDILGDDEKTACYWLLGKIVGNWRASFMLAKEGMYDELMETLRSIKESVALMSHFLVHGTDDLAKWFAGEIINPAKVRKSRHKWMNNEYQNEGLIVPIEAAMSILYAGFSTFTHSSYPALLHKYNPWQDDIDFDSNAGFCFVRATGMMFVKMVIEETLVGLKHFYQHCGDWENRAAVDNVLLTLSPAKGEHEHRQMLEDLIKRLA